MSDYWLDFTVPPGLMPDPKFDNRPARLEVHRVQPVYAHGRCPWVRRLAAVMIHGRTVTGSVIFDHRHRGGGELSIQENLARAGIDTFAPSLLGYGRSTRFEDGLDDPCNASLPAHNTNGTTVTCHHIACDVSNRPDLNPYDQQGDTALPANLATNPLSSGRCKHSTSTRFARIDVWVRDIRQVVENAIARAEPTNGKVTLIGYSAGATRVGRALYLSEADVLWNRRDDVEFVMQKTQRVVFMSPHLVGPNEEAVTAEMPLATFPLTLTAKSRTDRWDMSEVRHLACTGHVVEGSRDQQWDQILAQDPIGAQWGGSDPERPLGLSRSPTFSTYGFNPSLGGKIDKPVLVLQGMDDRLAPPANSCALYNTLATTRKVLVQVDCASHQMHIEGCSGTRCAHSEPAYGTPGTADFKGPHTTVQAALIEWIKDGRFNGSEDGRYVVATNGVVSAGAGQCPP